MSNHIQLVQKGDEAYVVLVKKFLGIPVPGKTYYYLNDKLATRSVKVWMSLPEANKTYNTLKSYLIEVAEIEKRDKANRYQRVAKEEKL